MVDVLGPAQPPLDAGQGLRLVSEQEERPSEEAEGRHQRVLAIEERMAGVPLRVVERGRIEPGGSRALGQRTLVEQRGAEGEVGLHLQVVDPAVRGHASSRSASRPGGMQVAAHHVEDRDAPEGRRTDVACRTSASHSASARRKTASTSAAAYPWVMTRRSAEGELQLQLLRRPAAARRAGRIAAPGRSCRWLTASTLAERRVASRPARSQYGHRLGRPLRRGQMPGHDLRPGRCGLRGGPGPGRRQPSRAVPAGRRRPASRTPPPGSTSA